MRAGQSTRSGGPEVIAVADLPAPTDGEELFAPLRRSGLPA